MLEPVRQLATSNNFFLASLRFLVKAAPRGTKSFSKPLGRTKSTGLSINSAHSLAVISLTVVKQSTFKAVCFSIECLLCIKFLCHLIAIIGKQIIIQRLIITSNTTTNACSMGSKDSCNCRNLMINIQKS